MAIVNYENLPSENTPLTGGSTGNLNVMQENGTSHGTDTKLGYAQSFLNEHIINVSNEVDEDYRVNLIETKNLFGIDNCSNITINSSGVIGANNEYLTTNYLPTKPNIKYYFSTTQKSGQTNKQIYIAYYDINKNFLSRETYGEYEHLFTTPANCYYMRAGVYITGQENYQLEKGEEKTTYEPFIPNQIVVDDIKYSDTLNVGTSLDSRSRVNVLYLNTEISTGNLEQGGFTNAGLPQDNATRVRSASFIATKPNTSYSVKVPSTMKVVVRFYNTNTSTSESVGETTGWVNEQRTFTTPSNGKYIKLLIGKQNDANLTPSEVTFVQLKGYVLPSIYVDNEMLVSKNIYSTGEVVIGEWLGKPLYRKVIDFGALPNNTTKSISIDNNIDFVARLEGCSKSTANNTLTFPIINTDNNIVYSYCNLNNHLLYVITNTDRSAYTNTKIILEYTKTTD